MDDWLAGQMEGGANARRPSSCRPVVECILRVGLAALSLAAVTVAKPARPPPARVMSLNVCTDQLAMLLAKPGQLISVSELATDAGLSFHSDLAAGVDKNRGLAEEVLLAKPNVVVTGAYSLHNTTPLLRRLGYQIEEFVYDTTLQSIPADIRRMGAVLGTEERAETLAASFEADLAAIEADRCGAAPTALAYDQNGIAMGAGSLTDSAMQAAGLRNLAAELGYFGMSPFSLELVVEHRPDIIILPEPLADSPALADLIAAHPAIRALGDQSLRIHLPRGSASCSGPFVIEAVKALVAARKRLAQCSGGAGG